MSRRGKITPAIAVDRRHLPGILPLVGIERQNLTAGSSAADANFRLCRKQYLIGETQPASTRNGRHRRQLWWMVHMEYAASPAILPLSMRSHAGICPMLSPGLSIRPLRRPSGSGALSCLGQRCTPSWTWPDGNIGPRTFGIRDSLISPETSTAERFGGSRSLRRFAPNT